MKSRYSCLLIVFILLILTISSVAAKDLNDTDSGMISQDLNQSVILDNSYGDDETILASNSNVSEMISESPSAQNNKPEGIYGIVNFGSNGISLSIYDVHDNEVTKKFLYQNLQLSLPTLKTTC
ncbi:hypothetical protein [Methanobrevibacter sp.]|uniref:hypothetical protein n=1 Tax=Methanobrevibacter sp. TaxID=66852 RepID=UPI0038908E89